MLQIDLRELQRGPVDTQGLVAPDDVLFQGLGFTLAGPVRVGGRLQSTGEDRFYWHGTLATEIATQCRRCLTPVNAPVSAEIGVLFSQDDLAADDPEAYALPPNAMAVDLRPAVREELALAVPAWVVCREDCRGLCPQCGKDLNAGPCGCDPTPDVRWQALADLKTKLRQ
jgi:uncharacterized protein